MSGTDDRFVKRPAPAAFCPRRGQAAANSHANGSEDGSDPDDGGLRCLDWYQGALTKDDETGFRGTASFDAYSFKADTFLVSSTTTDEGDRSLYLLDGNVVVEDNDSGGGSNSLIAHRIEPGDEYTIIVTSLWSGFGDFSAFEDGNEENEIDATDDFPESPGSFFEFELELVCCPGYSMTYSRLLYLAY